MMCTAHTVRVCTYPLREMLVPRSTLPRLHPVGYRKDGRPIFPIRGGSEPPEQKDDQKTDPPADQKNNGPEMVTDEHGTALYPKNTAVAEMTPVQQANYWRAESKKQQKLREDAERKAQGSQNSGGSGTVPDQQQSQTGDSEAAVQAAREAGRREAAKDAVLVTISATLQSRGKKPDEITELLDVVNPDKFLDEHGKIDGTKVANYVSRVAPASGSNGGGGNPGQGNHERQSGLSARDRAKSEAERRGLTAGDANRGALGGLRK
jgi:hypothetical protein